MSHLLIVAGKGCYLVVRDPNVVLQDAAVPRAGAQEVPLPGKRSHARRVPRHRPKLVQAHVGTQHGLKRQIVVTSIQPTSR